MSTPRSRREFLRDATLAAGLAGAAGACVPSPSRHRLPDRPSPPSSSTVAIVRPSRFASLREAIRAAVHLAGGVDFIVEGQRVLLKPCLNSQRAYPATADPETVLVLAQLVRAAGGVPFVADRTVFTSSTRDALRATGMLDAATQVGMDCLALEETPVVACTHPLATHWPGATIPVFREVVEADHVINFCTPRTHSVGDFTMAIKNNVGIVHGASRVIMHAGPAFKDRVAEIGLLAAPSLVVMDGRQGFYTGGPDEGELARPDFIAVGTDPVAVDAVGLGFLRVGGTNATIASGSIWQLPVLRRAVDIGLGIGGVGALRIVGLDETDAARLYAEMA